MVARYAVASIIVKEQSGRYPTIASPTHPLLYETSFTSAHEHPHMFTVKYSSTVFVSE